jgi:hypothetical protein
VLFLAATKHFDGFHGISYLLLVAGFVALALWLVAFGYRWLRTRPDLPRAGPEISEIPPNPESPAVVNFLVNNWHATPSGISATLVDLSARRVLGLDLVGHDDTVVRVRDTPAKGALTEYEEQVYRLVTSRATGGSAPIEAIKLDENSAEGWIKRFKKAVVEEARDKGLARKRWEKIDYLIVGIGLAFVFGFFALAFGAAHVGESSTNKDSMSPGDWLGAGAFAWFVAMGLVTRSQDVTDTPEGKKVCAQWLGMREYFRKSHAFDDQPPASVAIWDRLLAYGVATGAAHDAARGLPIVAEDPHTAWTRSTGSWREIGIEYPERFSFGQKPLKVFGEGLVRTVFWGGIAYFVLPVVAVIGWGILQDLPTSTATDTRGLQLLMAVLGSFAVVAGFYLSARTFAGVVRLVRGALDLGKTKTIEGEVVKVHNGRFAIDDGHNGSAVALIMPALGPTVVRGDRVRAVVSPHLHYLSSLTVLSRAAVDPSTAADAGAGAVGGAEAQKAFVLGAMAAVGAVASLTPEALREATGLDLQPAGAQGRDRGHPLPMQRFQDGLGNQLNITVMPSMAAAVPLFSVVTKLATRGGEPVAGLGDSAMWTHDRALIVSTSERVFVIDVEFPKSTGEARLEAARKVAGLLLGAG